MLTRSPGYLYACECWKVMYLPVPSGFILVSFQPILCSCKGDPLKLDHVMPLQNKTKCKKTQKPHKTLLSWYLLALKSQTPCLGPLGLTWTGPILSNTPSPCIVLLSVRSSQTLLFSFSHRSRSLLPLNASLLLPRTFTNIPCMSSSSSSFSPLPRCHLLRETYMLWLPYLNECLSSHFY